ncbi:MAG: type IV pilus modification protein PilV [Gammaproteobacteria bacterium]
MKFKNSHFQTGFTLIEILVAVIILAIGMLGLASLQINTIKANHGALQKTQATFLAYDIVDRLRANRNSAMAENYDIALAASKPSAGTALPTIDINDWMTSIENLLPSGDGAVDCDNLGTCTVTITWDIAREGETTSTGTAITTRSYSFVAGI